MKQFLSRTQDIISSLEALQQDVRLGRVAYNELVERFATLATQMERLDVEEAERHYVVVPRNQANGQADVLALLSSKPLPEEEQWNAKALQQLTKQQSSAQVLRTLQQQMKAWNAVLEQQLLALEKRPAQKRPRLHQPKQQKPQSKPPPSKEAQKWMDMLE